MLRSSRRQGLPPQLPGRVILEGMRANANARTRKHANVWMLEISLAFVIIMIATHHQFQHGFFGHPRYLASHVAVDARSLALGRMCLGCLVIIDVVQSRWQLRRLFLTDQGLWPRRLVLRGSDPQVQFGDFSFFMGVGESFWASAFLLLAVFAGTCTVLGVWTQASMFACWLYMYSLTYRGSGMQQAGDTLLRLLLFWSIFLPCGKRFSIDSLLVHDVSNHGTNDANKVVSLASTAVLVQLSMLYAFPAAFKTFASWKEGSAIELVLRNFAFSRKGIVTDTLLSNKSLTIGLTFVTPLVEHSAPLLLLFSPLRTYGVVIFVGFHLGLGVTMRLGMFPFVCIAGWMMVLPNTWWGDSESIVMNVDMVEKVIESGWMAVTLSTMSIFMKIVSYTVQWMALWLSVACNINTLPIREKKDKMGVVKVDGNESKLPEKMLLAASNNNEEILTAVSFTSVVTRIVLLGRFHLSEIFVMDDLRYTWARRLGVHQQWFLFDNPVKRSSWYRIIGTNLNGTQFDLHQMMLQCMATTSGSSWSLPSSYDSETLIYRPVKDSNVDHMSWENLYGSHRWRKFFQRLTDQRKRFAEFQTPYVKSLDVMWHECGLLDKYGPLKKVSCWGCWISLQSIGQELQEDNAILRRCAWQVVLAKEKSDKAKTK